MQTYVSYMAPNRCAKMYRVELYHKGDGDEVVEEMANIPCATIAVATRSAIRTACPER